jgi:hypothetical protein
VGAGIRSISSQAVHPTSPAHTSCVPGRTAKRKGFRSPLATMRRVPWSLDPDSGLPAAPSPVFGSTREMVPLRPTGSDVVLPS